MTWQRIHSFGPLAGLLQPLRQLPAVVVCAASVWPPSGNAWGACSDANRAWRPGWKIPHLGHLSVLAPAAAFGGQPVHVNSATSAAPLRRQVIDCTQLKTAMSIQHESVLRLGDRLHVVSPEDFAALRKQRLSCAVRVGEMPRLFLPKVVRQRLADQLHGVGVRQGGPPRQRSTCTPVAGSTTGRARSVAVRVLRGWRVR